MIPPETRERAEAAAYLAGWRISQRVPPAVLDRALRGVADRLTRTDGPGVRRLRANLARALPDGGDEALDDLTRAAMRSYLRYWGEVFTLPRWSTAEVRARVRTEDEHIVRTAMAAGRGVVGALPHMGNWDLAGAWACADVAPLATVVERLRPARVFEEFVRFRVGLGMTVLPMTGGPSPVPVLRRRLQDGGLVCLLADRDLSGGGVEVELLGEPARMPRGPAMLARMTHAQLIPMTAAYDGDGMRLRFFDPVPHQPGREGLRAMTQQVAEAFSTAIRDDPADWHMLQRVFAADLEARSR